MDIITQLATAELFNYFLKHWRFETMLIVISITITFCIMNAKVEKYKKQAEFLQNRMNEAFLQALKLYKILKEMDADSEQKLIKFYVQQAIEDSKDLETTVQKVTEKLEKYKEENPKSNLVVRLLSEGLENKNSD
mgnify:FL=1